MLKPSEVTTLKSIAQKNMGQVRKAGNGFTVTFTSISASAKFRYDIQSAGIPGGNVVPKGTKVVHKFGVMSE